MLREQVITPRAGRANAKGANGGGASASAQQRPAARRRSGGAGAGGATKGTSRWHRALALFPLVAKFALAVFVGLALFLGYRAAASASFFQVRSIEVDGARRSSKDEIAAVVRRAAASTGVWRADLSAISAELRTRPWVRSAVVTRVLPSGLRVRITEREPRMVARLSTGRFVWVDDDGVTLGTASASEQMPAFFVRGLDEAPTDAARAENRERIRAGLEMARAWEATGLARRVSEVNLDDLRDVRVQLSGGDSEIEVRLGREDFANRLGEALKKLDETRQKMPELAVTHLDATMAAKGGRVIIGYKPGSAPSAASSAGQAEDNEGLKRSATAESGTTHAAEQRAGGERPKREESEKRGATASAQRDKRERVQQQRRRDGGGDGTRTTAAPRGATAPAASSGGGGAERPRRVG